MIRATTLENRIVRDFDQGQKWTKLTAALEWAIPTIGMVQAMYNGAKNRPGFVEMNREISPKNMPVLIAYPLFHFAYTTAAAASIVNYFS